MRRLSCCTLTLLLLAACSDDSSTTNETSPSAGAAGIAGQAGAGQGGSLAGSDPALRKVIDDGSTAATQLRTFLQDNEVDLGELFNNLRITGDVIVKHLPGIRQIRVKATG